MVRAGGALCYQSSIGLLLVQSPSPKSLVDHGAVTLEGNVLIVPDGVRGKRPRHLRE